jgi:hypothetical protein
MAFTFAIKLVVADETMSRYLDLYTDVQSGLESVDIHTLKPFVSGFYDHGEFISAVADLDSIMPDLNLSKFYETDDQDAQEMIEAAVRDFLVCEGLVKMEIETH